jgi:hypothetical protein
MLFKMDLHLLGDKGYSLISWIMTPYKEEGKFSILEFLYTRKHKKVILLWKMPLAY